MSAEVELIRSYRFSAAHRYHRPDWSEQQNSARFGKCALAPGHGHNYRLTIRVGGTPDPETGFVVDLGELDRIVSSRVLDLVDHRHLNEAIPEFGAGLLIPSSENLVLWIAGRLASGLPSQARLTRVDLAEDDDLGASWRPNPPRVP